MPTDEGWYDFIQQDSATAPIDGSMDTLTLSSPVFFHEL
jgi:hypothetical protein